MKAEVLKSIEDQSVNFTLKQKVGYFEARYVRRREEYFIVYLSSQNGCNKGCKFCHLTATNQKFMDHATIEDYLKQSQEVFNHYVTQPQARAVNFNWMARGEPLANKSVLTDSRNLLNKLTDLSDTHNLVPKFNMSTIMPNEMKERSLSSVFKGITPTIYYSVYSMNPEFRKKWVPSGIDPKMAFNKLKEYQRDNAKIIKIHYAFIEGQNDSINDLEMILEEVQKRNLIVDWNIVRYNPFSKEQGQEPSDDVIRRNAKFIQDNILGKVKVIDRVGFDVKASCGMFIK